MPFVVIFLSIFTFSLSSSAEVYTWVDENGNRHYGDDAPAHANKAVLPAIHKLKDVSAPKESKPTSSEQDTSSNEFTGYTKLEIISPSEEQVITMGEAGQVSVQVNIYPPLQPGHQLALLLNGKQVKRDTQASFTLENIDRGSHLLQVQVKKQGRTLLSSPKRRIHVQRPSILNRPRT